MSSEPSLDPVPLAVPLIDAPQALPLPREYRAMGQIGWQAFGLIGGGGLFILLILGRWTLLLMETNPSPSAGGGMSGVIGGLAVIPVFMMARGVWLLRSVVRVVVDTPGLWVQGLRGGKWVLWQNVHSVRRDKKSQLMGDSVELLTLLDAKGRPLAKLPDTLGYFKQLAADIAHFSSATQGRVTLDEAAETARRQVVERKKVRRGAWLAGVMAVFFATIFGFGLNEMLHVRRYATEGVRADARILDHYMVRVTPRLKYEFKDADGRVFEREAMMVPLAWDLLEGQKTVPVEYLPSDPSWNRLVSGEQKGSSFGGPFLLLSGAGTVVLVAMTLFMALGFDIETEGGMKLMRHGKPFRDGGTNAGGATP